MRKISVKTGNDYEVLIGQGLLPDAGNLIASACRGRKAVIITDSNVVQLYSSKLTDALTDAGFEADTFVFEAGEERKNAETLCRILGFIAERKLTRQDLVIALGGGVTGDMAGLAAALYMRGIDYVQIPTSILAAVDSSVGGKTAIDLPQGKNLAGAFHQPALVIIDTELLATLPERDYRSGFAEVIKYGMIEDPRILDMVSSLGRYESRRQNELEKLIARCVEIKAAVVSEDEFEAGKRRLLNFGHTIGHAVEQATEYRLYHGEAVAIGMMRMTEAAVRSGRCDSQAAEALNRALQTFRLPTGSENSGEILPGKETLLQHIAMDKKNTDDGIYAVIPEEVGKCVIEKMTIERLAEFI